MARYYDTSYPPSILGLPASHDLQLVGTPVPATLTVDYTWDSNGKTATLAFGDGSNVKTDTEMASHTFALNGLYMATVVSGNARDSAEIDLSGAVGDDPEPTDDSPDDEPATYTAIPVDEIPSD